MELPVIPWRRVAAAAVVLALGVALWIALRPAPVDVDVATVASAPMSVTISEEGVARVRDVYALSAPIAGHLARTTLEPGDAVVAGETVVAAIHPLDPPFLDTRTEAELRSAAEAARTAVTLAEAERERAAAARDLARAERDRAVRLSASNTISDSTLERAVSELRVAEAQVHSADAGIRVRRAELAAAKARLGQPEEAAVAAPGDACCIAIRSPVDGVVLSLVTRSEQPVTIGAPIAEIGDPHALQIELDVLSEDAVRLAPDAAVTIDDWGGEGVLSGRIERIEPSAFEKVSALGIEERRVNVVVALDEVPDALGHGYRVYAKLNVWSSPDALQVPLGALFRDGGDWAVFVDVDGVARLRRIELGRMSDDAAQVLDGLTAGESVILYPSDRVAHGAPVARRTATQAT